MHFGLKIEDNLLFVSFFVISIKIFLLLSLSNSQVLIKVVIVVIILQKLNLHTTGLWFMSITQFSSIFTWISSSIWEESKLELRDMTCYVTGWCNRSGRQSLTPHSADWTSSPKGGFYICIHPDVWDFHTGGDCLKERKWSQGIAQEI